jgi:hypothetical protein
MHATTAWLILCGFFAPIFFALGRQSRVYPSKAIPLLPVFLCGVGAFLLVAAMAFAIIGGVQQHELASSVILALCPVGWFGLVVWMLRITVVESTRNE